jgi:5-methylcytosine-specific restriction endonuclease McrA
VNTTLRSLWETYRGRCCYCTTRMRKAHATIDHYMPKALGGTNERDNLRLACLRCNGLKGAMHPDAWEAARRVLPAPPPSRIDIRNELLHSIAPCARRFST